MHPRFIDGVLVRQHRRHKGWTGGLLLLVLMVAPLGGQTLGPPDREVTPLPATTGAPLTIAPVDGPDIDCSIQEWNPSRPKPYLKLLCPSEAAYAPVRVYLKLSWMKPDDVAKDIEKIITRPRQSTSMRANKSVVMVRMEFSEGKGQHSQIKWVDFNGVMDFALITDSRRH
jgi:hypothetical protein